MSKLSGYNENVKLIYNGYDPELFFQESLLKVNTFILIYKGLVFEYEQDHGGLLLKVVIQLENNRIINKKRIQYVVLYTGYLPFCNL